MGLIEDYGLEGIRAKIIKIIGNRVNKGKIKHKTLCWYLYPDLDIEFENRRRQWKSFREYTNNYWKSTEVEENLQTLSECDLIKEDKGIITLTELGWQVHHSLFCG